MMDERTVVNLYMSDKLPADITVMEVPIRATGYGDYAIITQEYGPVFPPDYESPASPAAQQETITLKTWYNDETGERVRAGYGPVSKKLLVGKEDHDRTA